MLYTAFTIGLIGSLHCVGMCGPIALAIPLQKRTPFQLAANGLLYNLGRTVTYILLGVIIGLLGKGLFLAGMQKSLSIFTGLSILAIVLFSTNFENQLIANNYFNRIFLKLKSRLGRMLGSPSLPSIFFTGLLNGLLPCGLVYLALVSALATGSMQEGALYMLFFGLGTIPLLLFVTVLGKTIGFKYRNGVKKLYPVFMTLLAFWFIFRGAQFYVPDDFNFWEAMQNIPMCH